MSKYEVMLRANETMSKMLEALRTKYSDLIYDSNQKMAVDFEEDIFAINECLQRTQHEVTTLEREACTAPRDDVAQEGQGKPTQQPLTEVMVHDLLVAVCSDGSVPSLQKVKEKAPHIFEFARAIEEAHGITGKK